MTNVREDGFRYTGGVVGVLRWSAVEAAVTISLALVHRVMGPLCYRCKILLSI